MSGFYRGRDDDGPWCEGCQRPIRDDEEEEDWEDGYCPDCCEPDIDRYSEDADPMPSKKKAIAEHVAEEQWSDLIRRLKEL